MPWVGDTPTRTDGTRTGPTVWQQAAVAVETILSADHDTHDQDMANMVGDCINRNGANTVTADISWGSFKLTNLGDGVNPNDAVNKNQMDTADAALQAAIDGLEADKLSAVVEDTSPQLGGHFDVNGFNIVSVGNGDIILAPDGTGKIALDAVGGEVVIQSIRYPKTPGTDGQVLVTNGVDAADWEDIAEPEVPLLAAHVTFNGNTGAILGTALNVSSVTLNSTGDYTVNFITNFSDANYGFLGSAQQRQSAAGQVLILPNGSTPTVSSCDIISVRTADGNTSSTPRATATFYGTLV